MYVLGLDDAAVADEGQHAAGLSKLLRAGFSQPDGFVLSKSACRDFFSPMRQKIDQIIANINYEDHESLNRASEQIENMIFSRPLSSDMRSEILKAYRGMSYTANISEEILKTKLRFISAGMEKTAVCIRPSPREPEPLLARFSNVKGDDELIFSIKSCWASLFSPNALYYRYKRQLSYEPTAVVVQKTINAEKSGFTITSFNKTQTLVEAVYGLVDSLRRNEQIADKYFCHKILDEKIKKIYKKAEKRVIDPIRSGVTKKTIPSRDQERPVLSENELDKLIEIGNDLESSFGPLRYEWCILRGKIYITAIEPFFGQEGHGIIEGEKIADAIPVSGGTAKGRVSMQEGGSGIVFLEKISENMLFDLAKADGVITKSGNISSIVSDILRDLRIPYVIASPYLQPGENVAIDGSTGLIYMIPEQQTYGTSYSQPTEHATGQLSDKDLGIPETVSTDILSMPPISGQEKPSDYSVANEPITATGIGCFLNKESYVQAKNLLVHGPKNLAISMSGRAPLVFWLQDNVGARYDDYNEPLPANIVKIDKPEEFGPESKAVAIRTPNDISNLEKFLSTADYMYFDMDSLIRFIVGDAYALESTASNESVRRVLSNARRVVKDRGRKSLIFSTLEDLPEFVKIGIDIIFVPEQDLNEARIVAAKTEREMLLELWRERKNS